MPIQSFYKNYLAFVGVNKHLLFDRICVTGANDLIDDGRTVVLIFEILLECIELLDINFHYLIMYTYFLLEFCVVMVL